MNYIMKKNIIYIFIVFLIFANTSCEDFLKSESKSTFTEQSAFYNVDFATKTVNGIYNNLLDQNLYEFIFLFTKCDNDIEFNDGNEDNSVNTMSHYNATSGTTYIKQMWDLFYQSIEMSNIIIDNLPKSKIWTDENSEKAHQLYAEAITLRALCYYELVITWGDVPFKIKSTQSGDNFNVPKTDRDVIYEYLIKDLADVEEYLPWMTETKTAERINRSFAKGLRARMALSYAGFSLRNKTLETRRGRKWEEYYRIANLECKELIESGKHKLNPNFSNIFKTLHSYSQDVINYESLFELPYGRLFSGRMAYTFGMQFSTSPSEPKYGRAAGQVRVPLSYFYTFDAKDTRRDVSVELYNYNSAVNLSKQWLVNGYSFSPTKWRKSWIVPSMGGTNKEATYTGVNFPLMRYSDIILMYAETENEINNGPTLEAKEALSTVRKRAFPQEIWSSKVTNYVDSVSVSKDDFFNAIVNERAFEFGGEFIRKQDLVRWNLLGTKIAEMKEKCRKIVNNEDLSVPMYLFWKYKDDGETIEILNPNERLAETSIVGYQKSSWISIGYNNNAYYLERMRLVANGYDQTKNNHLYPIATETITSSNGVLSNDQIP